VAGQHRVIRGHPFAGAALLVELNHTGPTAAGGWQERYNSNMTATLDEQMEAASEALARMDYLRCEALCVQALAQAREQRRWPYYARILLPLQEARRQRRQIAADGVIRLGTASLHGGPADWLDAIEAGCIVVTAPHTADDARALHEAAIERGQYVEVLFSESESSDERWQIGSFAGPKVRCERPAPPADWRDRWLDPVRRWHPPHRVSHKHRWIGAWIRWKRWAMQRSSASRRGPMRSPAALSGWRCWSRCFRPRAITKFFIRSWAMPRGRSTNKHTRRDRQAARTRGDGQWPKARAASHSGGRSNARAAKTPPSPEKKRRQRWGLVLAALILLVLLGVGGGVWIFRQIHAQPDYWQRNEQFVAQHDEAHLERLGETVRNRLIRDLTNTIEGSSSRSDHTATRRIQLELTRINAWLASRLDDWLANQGHSLPSAIGRVMVATENNKAILAFAYHGSLGEDDDAAGDRQQAEPRIASFVLAPSIDATGQGRLKLEAIRLGNMPVPRNWIIQPLREHLAAKRRSAQAASTQAPAGRSHEQQDAAKLKRLLKLLDGDPFEPRWRLDQRAARLVGIELKDRAIVLTIRHEPAKE
jgi:hypothetical protein